MAEVLSRQPADVQAFLLRTAILDRFCVSLCAAVFPSEDAKHDARACIDWVERANLFIIPLQGHEWYRYHQLFQDALLLRLRAECRSRAGGGAAPQGGRLVCGTGSD